MELPYEILVYLFKHLSHSDRLAASQTCRCWYEASRDNYFQNLQQICFTNHWNLNENHPANIFTLYNYMKFSSFTFKELDLSNPSVEFWKDNGEHIKNLYIEDCEMNEKTLVQILSYCPNLESLAVVNCRELFMSANFSDKDSKEICRRISKNLKSISLSKNRYLSDAIFDNIVVPAEALEKLDLSDCPITFHSALHKRFYPSNPSKSIDTPSESILTFPYIFSFIKNNAKSLKHLNFNRTLIDGVALKMLSELPDLQLLKLEISGCDQINKIGLNKLYTLKNMLTELSLGFCSRLDDQLLIDLCTNLINLKSLRLVRCNMITDLGVKEIDKLPKLQKLSIAQCYLVSPDGLLNGLCKRVNEQIIDLDISSINFDEKTIIAVSEKFPNLLHLNMSYCFTAVSDNAIQSIFKNLSKLRKLEVKNCDMLTDSGLTGMGVDRNLYYESPELNLSSRFRYQISLGSRAEDEIVRDAKRKKEVRGLCESVNGEKSSGFSFACLNYLTHVDISGCNKISDVSLMYAFDNKNLISLQLSDCQQITDEGLQHLVKNCPNLETLNLSHCFSICDEAVRIVVFNLSRLKNLNLSACTLLTDESLYAIRSACRCLKVLDIRNCRKISTEIANTLYNMPTMHTVHVTKPELPPQDKKKKSGKKRY